MVPKTEIFVNFFPKRDYKTNILKHESKEMSHPRAISSVERESTI
jgi:hypothetical protein